MTKADYLEVQTQLVLLSITDVNLKLCLGFLFVSPTFFQVAIQSRYIQGYRIFYRAIGNSWLVQDVEATSDQSTILADLHSNTEYEVKIRPYFNELQGHDSLMVLLRTPEEGKKCFSITLPIV